MFWRSEISIVSVCLPNFLHAESLRRPLMPASTSFAKPLAVSLPMRWLVRGREEREDMHRDGLQLPPASESPRFVIWLDPVRSFTPVHMLWFGIRRVRGRLFHIAGVMSVAGPARAHCSM